MGDCYRFQFFKMTPPQSLETVPLKWIGNHGKVEPYLIGSDRNKDLVLYERKDTVSQIMLQYSRI